MRRSDQSQSGLFLCVGLCAVMLAATGRCATAQDSDPVEENAPVSADESADDMGTDACSEEHGDSSRFSDVALPLQYDDVPPRPQPLLELGTPFMHPGPIGGGFELPTGAIWQPNFLVYGTYRTGFVGVDRGAPQSEWANRLDLFGNLQLSGTERILVGLRPLDEDGVFSGRRHEPFSESVDGSNTRVETLFFEGEIGEIFPALDPHDFGQKDIGFSVGRQPISFQGGQLIDDNLDVVAFTRNSLDIGDVSNLRITALFAWDDIHRGGGVEDETARLYGLLGEADLTGSTVEVDVIRSTSDLTGDALFAGVSVTQRLGHLNSTVRINTSQPDEESSATTRGTLLFSELSWTPHHSEDLVYLDAFVGLDRYSSAARNPLAGGPLGRTGILFAATGLGTVGAPLGNDADNAAGAAFGRQFIFNEGREQLILEMGARSATDGSDQSAAAIGCRYQRAFGQHLIVAYDLYGGYREQGEDDFVGGRVELLFKF